MDKCSHCGSRLMVKRGDYHNTYCPLHGRQGKIFPGRVYEVTPPYEEIIGLHPHEIAGLPYPSFRDIPVLDPDLRIIAIDRVMAEIDKRPEQLVPGLVIAPKPEPQTYDDYVGLINRSEDRIQESDEQFAAKNRGAQSHEFIGVLIGLLWLACYVGGISAILYSIFHR